MNTNDFGRNYMLDKKETPVGAMLAVRGYHTGNFIGKIAEWTGWNFVRLEVVWKPKDSELQRGQIVEIVAYNAFLRLLKFKNRRLGVRGEISG